MLQGFGVRVERDGDEVSIAGGQKLTATDVVVPGDISSAAFFLVAGALRPGWTLTIRGVGNNPTRTGIIDVLRAMSVKVELTNERESGGEPVADITVHGGPLRATEIGGALVPRLIDELPVLALLATQAEGTTTIRDAQEMRVKESDRIAIIVAELRKLGANIDERPDGMAVHGPTPLRGTTVTSPEGDHRIAMTLAVASLIAEGETHLENAHAIASSFPNFLELLAQVRA
jgi:3-phosphoshikimate 1-carboxyvinyltransferase